MDDSADRLVISTPEAVDVVLDLAGPGTRISSGVLDLALQAAIGIAGVFVIGALSAATGDEWAVVAGSIFGFLLIFFYDVAWELLNDGRTPGKSVLGLRVVRDDGRRVDGASSVVRNLLRIVELPLAYAPGIVLITLTRRHQRIGDMVAGTLVVREPRRADRALGRPAPGARVEAPADGPALRLDTAGLTDHDRTTARAFADRRLRLDPAERRDLAALIASGLRERTGGIPPGLADEDLVLHVARGSSLRG